jgi:N-methylhydantoinase B/oxoprolinase/acetone carboxylase alpha subunit
MRMTILALLVLSSPVFAANVTTADKVVDEVRIQMNPDGSSAVYYFVAKDRNWSSPDCPNAVYAYVHESAAGAKAAFAAALASKSTQSPIKFSGTCGNAAGDGTYLRVHYVTY